MTAGNNIVLKSLKDYEQKEQQTIIYGFASTDFGEILLGLLSNQNNAICTLYFVTKNQEHSKDLLQKRWPKATLIQNQSLVEQIAKDIFDEKENIHEVVVKGTDFQVAVWEALLSIPAGKTSTYSSVAEQIKKPLAVRAVASAVGKNEVSILIPCHRVIGKNGNTLKYGWGSEIKRSLLEYEKQK